VAAGASIASSVTTCSKWFCTTSRMVRLLRRRPATLNAEVLRHRDLHVADIFPIPYRFEKGIGEAEVQNILHRFLAEIVVDAKDRGFFEDFMQSPVERLRTGQSRPKGFSRSPGVIGAAALCSPWITLANMLGGIAR